MHIEPGVVVGAKMALSLVTAVGAAGLIASMARDSIRHAGGIAGFAVRSVLATLSVLFFFEILFKYPVGVSEVHLILGATLFLVLGAGPAAIGLALGLLAQGMFFAPADLPQYGMNITTLILPLWAVARLGERIIPRGTAYVDLRYRDVLALSAMYQGGIVAWVAFWAFYGQGSASIAGITSFAAAYTLVIVIEPLVDLAVLAAARTLGSVSRDTAWLNYRLYNAAPAR